MADRPSLSDETFKKFIEDLKKQGDGSFANQLFRSKKTTDNNSSKSEEQFNDLIKSSKNIEKAITGFNVKIDFQPVVDMLGNASQILQKQLEELTLSRKLAEGSLEYDKESAQYRNISGREIESKISGKTIKEGGYIDFETASDRLSGQSKRVRESSANKLNFAPVRMTGGKGVAALSGKDTLDQKKLSGISIDPLEKTFGELGKEFAGIFGYKGGGKESYTAEKDRYGKEFKRQGLGSASEGMLNYERRIKNEQANKEAERFGFSAKNEEGRLKPSPAVANPESDNIETPAEIQAKAAKEDLELTKQSKTIFEQQLFELKSIREALGGAAPTGKGVAPKPQGEEQKEESSKSLLDYIPSKSSVGQAAGKASTLGSKALKFLSGKGGAVLGGAIAVGAGAYTAYKGYSAAEDSKQAKMDEIQSKLDSGEINEKQAAELRKEAGNTATVEKSSAVGEGTGMAAGGIAGLKAGALIGTAIGGPIGTVVGGALGGAVGMFAGSKAGKYLGEKFGNARNISKSAPESTGAISPEEMLTPMSPDARSLPGVGISQTTAENQSMRDASKSLPPVSNTVVNNMGGGPPVQNFVPMRAGPRPDSTLSRYQDRIAAY